MSKEVIKAGYLTKSPPEGRQAIAQWQKRWFVFADSHRAYPLAARHVRMEYYQSEEDADKCKAPKGIIDLRSCSKVTNRESMRGFKHVFDVFTPERKYHLVADNEMEKRDWIETLNTTLFTLPPSHPHTPTPPQDSKQQQQHQVPRVPRPSVIQPTVRGNVHQAKMERPVSFTGEPSASRQTSRPLPPVPSNTAFNRPLPPTPPDQATTSTRYKRLPDAQVSLDALSPSPRREHQLIRQTKSTSAVQEGPDCYQLSARAAPDYENVHAEENKQTRCSHDPRDYENLDQDYDDTVDSEAAVYEDYSPRPIRAAPITSPPQAPISNLPGKKGYTGYVNVPNLNTITDEYSLVEAAPPSENYSLLEAAPLEHSAATTSDEYSVLEAVYPQPTARDGDYSRLEVSGHLDLSVPPNKPSPYGSHRKATDVDYENLGHVAHPEDGDYSNLHY